MGHIVKNKQKTQNNNKHTHTHNKMDTTEMYMKPKQGHKQNRRINAERRNNKMEML